MNNESSKKEVIDKYLEFDSAFDSIGIKVLSDDICCQLLAFYYAFGSEEFVINKKLNADLNVAQRRLRINGGDIPDGALIETLQKYVYELVNYKRDCHPWWLNDIAKKYKIELNDSMNMVWATPSKEKKEKEMTR